MTMVEHSQNNANPLVGFPIFFKLACRFAHSIQYGALRMILPDGRTLEFTGQKELETTGTIIVRDYAFARRAIFGGDIGFFESYASGQWDTPDLADCLYIFARNADYVQGVFKGVPFVDALNNLRHAFNRNTRSGSKRNIEAHYDLGNAFYERWLDPSMTYSSARFEGGEADLSIAQENKYRRLAEMIDLRPGERVLEIGSGWGGFAEYAAKNIGANIVGITLSPAQYDYARERIFKAGLNDRVEFRLQDYRDVPDKFDKVASIEMFEAVGKQYWQTYFDKVRDVLNPGGIAGFQIITIADRFFTNYESSTDFIQRYVFPGGMLPSPSLLNSHIEQAGLTTRAVAAFGQDYAQTLNEWRHRFELAWDEVRPLGFDERFRKLWRFYLSYCEAGFRAGTTDVRQISLSRA